MVAQEASLDDVLRLARDYRENVHTTSRAQYRAGDMAAKNSNWLGLPVVVVTTIVGTSIFATIGDNPDIALRVGAGVLSLAAAVLSAVQTFFKFSERAQNHRAAGASYSSLRRELDIFLLKYENESHGRHSAIEELSALAKKISEHSAQSPAIPNSAFKMAKKETITGEA